MPIQLSISDVCEEIRHLKDAASDLLDHSAEGVLSVFEQQLQSIVWTDPGHKTDWALAKDLPLVTRVSKGEFYFDGKVGEHHCFAEITCLWEITPVKAAKRQKPTMFEVIGVASVHVQIFDTKDGKKSEPLGSWRMELGDHKSPGCFFHTQILAEKERKVPPFPHSLDVPRLPNFVFTPMSVVEFVLGELFQDEWRKPARQIRPEIKGWARIQRERLLRVFMWHIRQAAAAKGSPWIHVKCGIPDPDWFIRPKMDVKNPSSFLE